MASAGEDSHGGKALTNAEIRKYFTAPQQAGEFARATGVDALAVCFGTWMRWPFALAPCTAFMPKNLFWIWSA